MIALYIIIGIAIGATVAYLLLNPKVGQLSVELARKETEVQMLKTTREQLRDMGQLLADAQAKKLKEENRESMGTITQPLKDAISEMRKAINDNTKDHTEQSASLREQLRLMMESNREIGEKAEGLANVLRRDNKVSGNMGEIILGDLLTSQGLTDGINGKIDLQSVAGYIDAYTEVSRYLSSHKNIDAIVAQNDIMAIESAKAVRDAEGYGKGSVRIMGVDGITVGLQAIANGDIECSAVYPTRGDLLVTTAAAILSGAPFVRDTVIETTMVDATMAPLLLRQFELRTHDLETMQMVNKLAETNLHNIRIDRNLLIIAFIVVSALLLLALLYVLYRQTMMQTKINRTIRQVEDVQEAIQLNHRDAAFAERMRQIVDSHLTDPKLNVEYLATALQLDRTQVFRRVKSVTGKGPAEYIREQRLIRANEQLRTTDKSIRQIANELCFSSPGYFSKYYKDYFGHLPSEQ